RALAGSPAHALPSTAARTAAPPTALSTLSLHDALPIYLLRLDRRPSLGQALHRRGRRGRLLPGARRGGGLRRGRDRGAPPPRARDRKSTRLNSSHVSISYAVFCLTKKRRRASRQPAPRL